MNFPKKPLECEWIFHLISTCPTVCTSQPPCARTCNLPSISSGTFSDNKRSPGQFICKLVLSVSRNVNSCLNREQKCRNYTLITKFCHPKIVQPIKFNWNVISVLALRIAAGSEHSNALTYISAGNRSDAFLADRKQSAIILRHGTKTQKVVLVVIVVRHSGWRKKERKRERERESRWGRMMKAKD